VNTENTNGNDAAADFRAVSVTTAEVESIRKWVIDENAILLDCLVTAGLLRLAGCRYELTPTAEAFLVRGQASYAGDWVLAETDPRFWEEVLGSVRTGERAEAHFPWPQDAWLESCRSDRPEQAPSMWLAAGIDPGGTASTTLHCSARSRTTSRQGRTPSSSAECELL
jgi:hypothetical protein